MLVFLPVKRREGGKGGYREEGNRRRGVRVQGRSTKGRE